MATGAFGGSIDELIRAAGAAATALEGQKKEYEAHTQRALALRTALSAWAAAQAGVEVPVTPRFCAKGHEKEAATTLSAFVLANVPSDAWADANAPRLHFGNMRRDICDLSKEASEASSVVLDAVTAIRAQQFAALRQRVQSVVDEPSVSAEVRERATKLLQELR